MKIQKPRLERILAWARAHKLPLIITASILALIIATLVILLIFVFPRKSPTIPSDPPAPEKQPAEPEPTRYYSKLSGIEISDPALNETPLTCIMIENSPSARPHSGIHYAPIVYEAIAEGGITRFLTIWQNSDTRLIGPVRSLRLYYLDWATPYDCAIAHVGGSAEALAVIRNSSNGYRDIDQFYNGAYYWRSTDRYAPHNVYTSSTLMASINEKRSYTTSDFQAFPREIPTTEPAENSTAPAYTTIHLKISSVNYNPVYTYDPNSDTYLRAYQNGSPHMSTTTCPEKDKPQVKDCDQQQLAPSVVIAMSVVETDSAKEPGREAIATTGSGEATIFQHGQIIHATWSRNSIHDQITFADHSGTPIALAPGQVWISAIPSHRYPTSVIWE